MPIQLIEIEPRLKCNGIPNSLKHETIPQAIKSKVMHVKVHEACVAVNDMDLNAKLV